jgi:phosphoribosyl 1,2-cyclic phosphate phosphodiesterase
MSDRLHFLGTGDALGVPRVYCDCAVCTEARRSGLNRRRRSSVALEADGSLLFIDCGPDFRSQMESLDLRWLDTVLITHAHHDHIGGLPDLADAARWVGKHPRVVAPAPVIPEIVARYPWLPRSQDFVEWTPETALLGYQIHTWEVCHGKNGRSWAYRFERPGFTWVYCPDSIRLAEPEWQPMQGADLLVLGTAYYKEDAPALSRSVYDMNEALDLLALVKPRRAVFTHLSHGVDRREAYPLPPHVTVAHDGLVLNLSGAPEPMASAPASMG